MAINDFNIGFLGKLDGTRSKNQINQDIESLKKSLNSLEIKATLDPQQKNALTKQLNLLQVSLNDASFSPKALNDLVSQVNNALKGIQIDIPNINTSAAGKSAIQAGKQIGNQIQNGINSSIQKQDLWKNFGFSANNQNNVAKEAQKYFAGISNGIVTVQEHMSEIDGDSSLDRFVVNIKNAKGEVESLNYSLRNITDSNGNATGQHFAYTSGSINDAGAIKQFQQMEKAVTDYQNKLENLKTKYANLNINFSGFENELNNFKTGKTDVNGLSTAFNNLNNSITSTVNNLKSQTSSFDQVQQALNNMRDLPSMIQNLETKMSGLSDKTSVAGINIKDLQSTYSTLLSEMNANGGKIPTSDKWINSFKTLTSTVAGATKQLDTLARAEAKAGKSNLTQKISNLQRLSKVNTIGTWADNNSKAMKKYGDRINEIITRYKQLNVAMDKVEANKLEAEFKTIKNVSREAGEIGATAFDKLGKAWEKFGGWSIATGGMVKGIQEIKYGIKFIGELDDAMADVAYTTPMTVSGLEKLGNSAIDMSKELKTSATNVLEAVKIYSTANTTADEILAKSRASILLSNVSGMSGEDTSQTVQTILNQFELDSTNESLIGIVDTLEYVASQLNYDFSKSMKEISSGISESGNVAKQAGLSLEEYATILGTTIERSGIAGSQAGNAYKTIFSRITGASKTEGTLDEDISKAETSLRSVGVQVRDTENEFRDLTDIMSDLGSVWDSLSSTEKSNIGYNIAGIRQLNVLNSLMSGWKDYEKIIESVDNKVGTAEKNQEKYEKTLQGSLSGLEAQKQAIWNNLLNSDDLSSGIDLLSELLSLLDGVSKAFVDISSIAGGGNALGGSLGAISGLIMSLTGNGAVQYNSANGWGGLIVDIYKAQKGIMDVSAETTSFFEKSKSWNFGELFSGMDKEKRSSWIKGINLSDNKLKEFLTTWDGTGDIAKAYQSYMKKSASATGQFSRATKAAGTAIKSIGAAMSSMAVMWAVGEAISLVVEAIDSLTSANERFLESQQTIVDSSNENITSYESEIDTLETLKDKLEDAQGDKSKLASIQSELNDVIGVTPNLLDTESNSYDVANQKLIDRIKLLDELREAELKKKTTAVRNIYNNNVIDNDWGSDKGIYDYFKTTQLPYVQNTQAFDLLAETGGSTISPNGIVTVENYDTLTKYLRVLAQKNDKSMAEIMASFLENNYQGGLLNRLPNAQEIQAYFDSQFNMVKEILSDYINNLDTVLPKESLYSVLQGMVESNPEDADKVINSFKAFIGSLEDKNLEDIYSDYIESLSDNSIDSNALYNQLQNTINNLISQFPEAKTQLEAFANSVVTSMNSIFDNRPVKMSLKDAFELDEYSNIKEKLLELAKSGELSPETLSSVDEYNSLLEKTSNNAKDAYFQIQNMLSATEKLSAASNGLNSIKGAFKDVEDNGFVLASTLSSLPDVIKGLDGYDVFAAIVGDPTQGVDAIQNAFNEITKQYLLKTHTFSGLVDASSSEIQSYIANLKAMGITNAEEIVNQIDAELKAENDLINKAEAEYNDYLNNKDEATLSYLESASSNNSQLIGALGSTYKTDYDNWIDLLQRKSEAYNSFVKKIGGAYNDALTIMDNLSNNGVNMSASNISDAYIAQEEYKKLQKEAQSFKDNFKISLSTVNTDFKSNFNPKTSSGSSSSSTEDTWKAEFDAQYKTLKHQLAMNEITESQYYKTLDGLNKKYFANRKEYLEEYRQYEEEVYNGELSLQDKAISAIEKLRGLRVDMIKDMKQNEIDAINKVIDAEKKKLDAINETIDARKKAIELLKDETDHEQELAEKNKSVSDIQIQIESLKFDNSASAQKKRRELEEQLAEEQKNLSDYIADYEYDKAIESLDKESEIAEERYDKKEKKLQDQIQLIEEYLNNESQLIKDAMVDLNGMNDSMFSQMKKWAKETSGDVYGIVNAWKEAYESLKIYNGLKNIGGTYNSLQSNASKNTATNISTNKVSTSGNSSSSSTKNSPTSSGTGVKATHTVRAGDTLWALAGKYYGKNTKYTKIKNANPNVNPNNLKVGSKLLIPFKSGGYTGNSEGLAILHKKEQVLNAEQTESWQNLVKDVLPKVQDMIPAVSKIPDLSKLINSHSTPNISIGDINIQGSTNLTKSDLNKFRNDIVDDVFTEMQKSRVKSGRI